VAGIVAKHLGQDSIVFSQEFETETISDHIGYDLKADGHECSFCEA
jgi:hypothetical protein